MNKILLIGFLLISLSAAAPEAPDTKVVVLGIAQDGGIPHIGCTQEICRTQKHFISALAIVHEQSVFLIDATPDLREQYAELIKRYPQVTKKNLFDGIFLTHAHMGHYTGLVYLGKESVSTKEVPVYGSEEMTIFLKKNAPWSLLVDNKNIVLKPFASEVALDFGFKITPVAVPHRKEFTDTHGFLIQGRQNALLYIPDIDAWEPVKDSILKWLKMVDYALLDGTFYSGQELPGRDIRQVPHPTVEHSIMFFKTFPDFAAEIFFTHLNHTNPVLNPRSSEAHKITTAGHLVAVDWQEFTL
jgi:pyrroloquinoline quinone biosynthesis protein B